ncbi:MAG: beta-galactosidase [Fimbriimonadaceae bacterium]|nr:beta-galactosidase [Fimbriimonadaceae bacterium]
MTDRQYVNPRFPTLWHGGDYNPDQWPPETLDEDLRLMDLAQCDTFTLGVFSWTALEPTEGVFTFDWLDRVMDVLAKTGKRAILATPSAAMPAWAARAYPDILRVGPDGVRHRFGERVNHCWSSPEYRRLCRNIAEQLAVRYGEHPALALWHVSNEYSGECFCGRCHEAFRSWLKTKFGGELEALNQAYWTSFWSHTFTDWDQIPLPGWPHGDTSITGLQLDWRRFVTDQVAQFMANESAPLREHSTAPITTNMMGTYQGLDYHRLADQVDVIAWDSYPCIHKGPVGPDRWTEVAFTHDLNRAMKRRPFLLIECTPSSSNWAPVMALKRPGAHRMEGLQAVAHGSDSVLYFQWRQSRGSREKYHGAVVQHDGTSSTRVFGEVSELGAELKRLTEVAGTETHAEVAIVYDWENSWAIDLARGPRRGRMGYLEVCYDHYRPFLARSIATDVIASDADLAPYRLVVAPMLYLLKPGVPEILERFVSAGGTLVTTYWTGMVDENERCFFGGFPGPLRELCGIWNEEIDALHDERTVDVEFLSGNALNLVGRFSATELCELVHAEAAEVLAAYASDFYAGRPAITLNRYGLGEVYYVASRNDRALTDAFYGALVQRTGLASDFDRPLPQHVYARKRSGTREHLFLINTGDQARLIDTSGSGYADPQDRSLPNSVTLPPHGVWVGVRPLSVAPSPIRERLSDAR